MNLLAIDTSTERMSVGVQRGDAAHMWLHEAEGGAAASRELIGAIQALMDQANLRFEELDAVAFGAGPGSFTGLRTACSVAQGLAFATDVPVLPVGSLLAVAEAARAAQPVLKSLCVVAALDARMDECYVARYGFDSQGWRELEPPGLVKPKDLVCTASPEHAVTLMAGNVWDRYAAFLPPCALEHVSVWPTAAAMLRLAPPLLGAGLARQAQDAHPIYVRNKVAQTTQERQAASRTPGSA